MNRKSPAGVLVRILASNPGRDPALLALKWEKMRGSPFGFFRGTAPLFYQEWARIAPRGAPLAWISGDAHPENVGSYRGENRVAYFDLNDFDEGCLAPVDWEVGRALACLFVLGKPHMARLFLTTYLSTLAAGKPGHIEPEVAVGPIAQLLEKVGDRSRRAFLDPRVSHRGTRLRIRPGHSRSISSLEKKTARRHFTDWAKRQADPAFYRVLDLCGCVAGNGSLGLRRYLVLVRGKKLPVILDMKAAIPPAPRAFLRLRQPAWSSDSERVATIQYFLQYVPIARLGWTGAGRDAYVILALQPAEDRIDVAKLSDGDYADFVSQWARLVASGHLRSGGWKGSADLGRLIAYGQTLPQVTQRRLLAVSRTMAALQRRDYLEFKKSRLGRG
jgi:uncharacterized protein (DUF2252 family)